MKYILAIDWLTIFCAFEGEGDMWQPLPANSLGNSLDNSPGTFSYKKENFGTRCFSRFYRVRVLNPEGGLDEFAEIQASPYSSILPEYAVMVRFVNRFLYLPNFWELADALLIQNSFSCRGISRIDICADFNNFETISPLALIEGFAAKKYRHIGRGVGALYFNHGVGAERDEQNHPIKDYGVQYTGLSFGTHASDAHVYLYNKTYELLTQGDKPWIKDTWVNAGLDIRHVWRLEVSLKAKGLKFRDKKTKTDVQVDVPMIYEAEGLNKIYFTFVTRLFSFIANRKGITNVSREPRLLLFGEHPIYDRGSIRNISVGGRMERILIRQLYEMSDRYRGAYIYHARERARKFAADIAAATGLYEWLEAKKDEWETPIHK